MYKYSSSIDIERSQKRTQRNENVFRAAQFRSLSFSLSLFSSSQDPISGFFVHALRQKKAVFRAWNLNYDALDHQLATEIQQSARFRKDQRGYRSDPKFRQHPIALILRKVEKQIAPCDLASAPIRNRTVRLKARSHPLTSHSRFKRAAKAIYSYNGENFRSQSALTQHEIVHELCWMQWNSQKQTSVPFLTIPPLPKHARVYLSLIPETQIPLFPALTPACRSAHYCPPDYYCFSFDNYTAHTLFPLTLVLLPPKL